LVLAGELLGKEVISSQGQFIGKISDLEFDEKDWRVIAFSVELNKEVAEEQNLRRRFRKSRVSINVDHVQGVGDRVVLKGSKEDILKLIAATPMSGFPSDENPSS